MQTCKVSLSLLRRPLQRAAVLATSPSIASSAPRVHGQPAVNNAAATLVAPQQLQRRRQSTTATEEPTTGEDTQPTTSTTSAVHVMEKAADARREIHELWSHVAAVEEEQLQQQSAAAPFSEEEASSAEARMAEERCAAVAALLEKYALHPSTPREEDVSRGLGDALDRLLLLCVPLSSTHSTDLLVCLMQVCARQGRQLSMRSIQHLFARTNSYAEALAIFYAMRRSNFAMSMEAYHAMLYSLQRLEEEGWAQRFHHEFVASKGEMVSEQALDFVLRGVDNQLLPENKPWLGRVMFADAKHNAATQRQSRASFDEMGQLWVERYKSGSEAAPPPSQ